MGSLRTMLFDDITDSPVTSGESWGEIEAVLTPFGIADKSADCSFSSGADLSIEIPVRKSLPKSVTSEVRRSLFCGSKRLTDQGDIHDTNVTKRLREVPNELPRDTTQSPSSIISAVDRLATDQHLVADGSRDHCLPTIPGKHGDLKSISCDTMAGVLAGKYAGQLGEVTVVDCRYPYEFEGGHIKGAVNLYTKDAVQTLLQNPVTSSKKHVLIFHSEFSSERGPKMYCFLRSQDRELNKDHYPALNFPDVYLLHGGYKQFYTSHAYSCYPASYKPMLHEDHVTDLRHFRAKSWTYGERQATSRRSRSRLTRHSLEFFAPYVTA